MSVLQRIPGQEGKSGAPADSVRRREEEQRGVRDAGARERSAKFKAALGQRDAQVQARNDDHKEARLTRQDMESNRVEERGRDRAAAAEVLGRLGLDQDAASDVNTARQTATAVRSDAPTGSAQETGTAGSPATGTAAPLGQTQAGRLEGAAAEVGPEVAAIENAIERVIESDVEPSSSAAGLEGIPTAVPWARPEGPARPEAPRRLPEPPPGTEAYHRLLMGQGPAGAEARLTITQGPLAGLQIQLVNGPRGVQAAVLTQGASSRQTLVSAMDQVAQRLRQKGHNLELKLGGADGAPGAAGPRRG